MNDKVYIIILNYNGWADTIECLESVLRNDYPNYQVIVVDNNSPNNSMEYFKPWADGKLDVWVNPKNPLRNLSFPPISKPIPYVYYAREEAEKGGNKKQEDELKNKIPEDITTKYPLVIIQSGANLGFAGGNNIGIKYALAKNDFDSIILLNNDTVIKKDTILKTYNTKNMIGEHAIYGGRIFYYSNPEKIWFDGGKFNEWTGRSTHLNMGKYQHEFKNDSEIKEVNFITFCYVLIPKLILNKIGLLDESYFMYVEDLDYSYKVWKNGFKLFNLISAEIWHKVGASSGEKEVSEFSAYYYYKNSILFNISREKGIKKILSLNCIILKTPLIFLKWLIKDRKILAFFIKGNIDGFRNLFM